MRSRITPIAAIRIRGVAVGFDLAGRRAGETCWAGSELFLVSSVLKNLSSWEVGAGKYAFSFEEIRRWGNRYLRPEQYKSQHRMIDHSGTVDPP